MYPVFMNSIVNSLIIFGLIFSGLGWSLEASPMTTTSSYKEGEHYQRLEVAIVSHKSIQDLIAEDPHKIQIIEFFNYGCFWCSRLHPILEEWAKHKPKTVVYYRFPITFNPQWAILAKAYYVAKALNKNETLDPEFFKAIHQQSIDLANEKLLTKFFVEHGIPEKKFLDLYHSFTIHKELTKAIDLANAYRITQSPVIIMNAPSGSYLLTAKMAGSEEALLVILNQLVSRESKKLGG